MRRPQEVRRRPIVALQMAWIIVQSTTSAAAALRLAATYDPHEVQRLKVHSVMSDRAVAHKWYERARDLGALEAEELLAKLAN
jgi:hypothetical protein